MSGLLDGLMQHLDQRTLQHVGTELGTDPATTQSAVSTAMPVLLAALARNASNPTGADALAGALDRDHASVGLGDIASMLGSAQGSAQGGAGQKMLGHILGGGQPAVAQSLGAATGLDSGRTMKLLAMLAPMVLAYLARQKQEKGLDAGGLGSMLGTERDRLQTQGGALGGLMSMLDRDKDGSVVDDVGGMVGKMFGR